MKLYKDGNEVQCDKLQLDAMVASGWSRTLEPEVKPEEDKDPGNSDDSDKTDETGAPEDDKKESETSPVVPDVTKKKKVLKKKKD